jgi:lysophospholipase L1-like esterase
MRLDRFLDVAGPQVLALTRGPARRRRERFRVPAPPGRVLFLGDSITEGGLWDELFSDVPVLNRGIGGDTTVDLRQRMDDAINEPRLVSLLIGTNDLHGPRSRRHLDGIAARWRDIVDRIRERAPGADILLSGLMPRTTLYAERLRALNVRYRAIAAETGAEFIDLWPALADSAGELREDYTRDHLHLTAAGYQAWAGVLGPYVEGLGRTA